LIVRVLLFTFLRNYFSLQEFFETKQVRRYADGIICTITFDFFIESRDSRLIIYESL
jgi:hypothetical protein